MLTIRQMMRYLRNNHNMSIKSNQAHALRNLGYYHGYKGYRFIRTPQNRISFRTFDELLAINNFDMHLKSEMYPLYWTPSKEGTFCVIRLNLS